MWWMINRDSSDTATLFHWSIVQLRCSWAQHRHSWRWHLVCRSTWVCHLPCSFISSSVYWTLCSDAFLLGSALYWVVSWATAWLYLASPNGAISDDLFLWYMWTFNTMPSIAGFAIIHPLCISTNNYTLQTTH